MSDFSGEQREARSQGRSAGKRKIRVAVLGGGTAGLAAAFDLLDRPGARERFEVTVYQIGWRLGGKAAGGRRPHPDGGQRIEERSGFVWLGSFDNAFHLLQRVYHASANAGLLKDAAIASAREAVEPDSLLTLLQRYRDRWYRWNIRFPRNSLEPGRTAPPSTPWDYVRRTLESLVQSLCQSAHPSAQFVVERSARAAAEHPDAAEAQSAAAQVREAEDTADTGETDAALRMGAERFDASAADEADASEPYTQLHLARDLAAMMSDSAAEHTAAQYAALQELLADFRELLRRAVFALPELDLQLLRLWITSDLRLGCVLGMLADKVPQQGFGALDRYDFREWLAKHGVSEEARNSPPVKALYDKLFAYEGGNEQAPNLAAGSALRFVLRACCDYKGSFYYRLQAGMADTLFAPLYRLLKAWGVRFEFFHRLDRLHPTADGAAIDAVEFGIQATVRQNPASPPRSDSASAAEYDPLVPMSFDGGQLWTWPAEPRYEQLVEGAALRSRGIDLESAWADWPDVAVKTLRRGVDFDHVILGVPAPAVSAICRHLATLQPKWDTMLDHVRSVPTQSCRLWLNRTARQLGWVHSERLWAAGRGWSVLDATLTANWEHWPPDAEVRSVTHFTSVLPEADDVPQPFSDPDFPAREHRRVKSHCLELLSAEYAAIWPRGTHPHAPESVHWDALLAPSDTTGEVRFDAQFWRANVNPAERFVQTRKSSTRARLRADQSGFANLFLAGDWTENGVNVSCVEAAAISGFQAARAVRKAATERVQPLLRRRIGRPSTGAATQPPLVPPDEFIPGESDFPPAARRSSSDGIATGIVARTLACLRAAAVALRGAFDSSRPDADRE